MLKLRCMIGLLLLASLPAAASLRGVPQPHPPQPAPAAIPDDSRPPNVLIILADDMGFADLNVNNPQLHSPTPRLNELAATGVRFTRHYTESTCSPSRAALLSGRYPARANFKPNGFGLPPELQTMPKAFQAAGYRTHQIGKWHLGHLVPEAWPDAQGFDTWLGFLNQWLMVHPDRDDGFHYSQTTHRDVWLQNEKGVIKQYPGHLTDVSSDEAIRLIHVDRDRPWFMYLAYYAPHEPMEPRIDYARQFPFTPGGRYAALVAHLDARIKDVIDALKETGQYERTIIVFASDNGGVSHGVDSNAPYRGRKVDYLEGGIRTPLLISWPGHIAADRVTDEVVSIMDIYPTVATLAHVPFPADLDGRPLFEGGGALVENAPPRPLFWDISIGTNKRYGALSADGRWRLYRDWLGEPSLFDLATDPISAVDVAAQHPDIVARLKADFEQWEAQTGRLPLQMPERDANGRGLLLGDRLQRATTFADFTIAIGATPARTDGAEQVILEQKPGLRIASDAAGVHIRLHGLNADLPPLPAGRCTSLALTGTFNRKIQVNDFGASTLTVYVDGEKVKSIEQKAPFLDSTDIGNGTYVGRNPDGGETFDGSLSMPIYLNRRADVFPAAALDVAGLTRAVCPAPATASN